MHLVDQAEEDSLDQEAVVHPVVLKQEVEVEALIGQILLEREETVVVES